MSHPAFDGGFQVLPSGLERLRLSWRNGSDECVLEVGFRSPHSIVELTNARGVREKIEL